MQKKKLQEKKSVLMADMRKIIDSVKTETEVRALSEDELKNYESLKKQVEEINKTLELLNESIENETTEKVEEKGKENMTEERAIQRKKLLAGEEVSARETRTLQAAQEPGKDMIGISTYPNIIGLPLESDNLYQRFPVVESNEGKLAITVQTGLGTLPQFLEEGQSAQTQDGTYKTVTLEAHRMADSCEFTQKMVNDANIDIVGEATELVGKRMNQSLQKSIIDGVQVGTVQVVDGIKTLVGATEVETKTQDIIEITDFQKAQNEMPRELLDSSVWVMSKEIFGMLSMMQNGVGVPYLVSDFDVIKNRPVYRFLGCEILINEFCDKDLTGDNVIAYLVSTETFKSLVQKPLQFKMVNNDSARALNDNVLLVGTVYTCCKNTNPKGVVRLKAKA